jgi:subtilisin family serine protease
MSFTKNVSVLVVLFMLTSCGGGGSSSSVNNAAPVAADDRFTLDSYAAFEGDLGANDTISVDGGNVWALATDPAQGRVVVNSNGRFTYYPAQGFVGSVTFTYSLTDINGDINDAIVTLLISPIEAFSDPLISDQWYLKNTGQATITGSGTAGADIGVFAVGSVPANNNVLDYAQGYTGNGIQIAIVDTGLEILHADLNLNVMLNGSYNFSYPNNTKGLFDPTATNTNGDHGTGVAGLAAARGGNGIGIWGVAPSAELKGFNFLATQEFNEELASLGYKPSADTFTGLTSTEVDIFNKSYGRNAILTPTGSALAYYDSLIGAMEWGTHNLRSGKGAIYVKAGGNEFGGGNVFTTTECQQAIDNNLTCYNVNMETEHASPFEIVIGAFNANDVRASYSNTGSALWLSAPGGDSPSILTTDQSGCSRGYNKTTVGYDVNCDYFAGFNGTSAATPMVSGAVALLLEANPALNWRDIKHILATTARQIDTTLSSKTLLVGTTNVTLESGWVTNVAGYKYSNAYGFGALNIDAALTMALQWKTGSTTLPALQTVTKGPFILSTSNNIPDNSAVGLTETTSVVQTNVAESVALTLTVEGLDNNTDGSAGHNIDISDYQIILKSPAGTESILLTPFNAYQPHYDMTGLSLISHAFYGESMNGDWKLIIRDLDNTVDGVGLGKLAKWSLKFYGH